MRGFQSGFAYLELGKFIVVRQMIQLAFEKQGSCEEARKGQKAVNWWGMSADVIDVICSGNLPHGTMRLIEFLKIPFVPEAFIP